MKKLLPALFCLLFTLFITPLVMAIAPMTPDELPDTLKPWVNWVLYDQADYHCPLYYPPPQQTPTPYCQWPADLALELDDTQGQFQMTLTQWTEDWVILPGDSQTWPQAVYTLDQPQQPIWIAENTQGQPQVYLPAGTHTLKGYWRWKQRPESLTLPATAGLVKLTLNGQPIPFPDQDKTGKLWLSHRPDDSAKPLEDRLDMRVERLLEEGIPFKIHTRIHLEVAGQAREITLGQVLTDAQWLPLQLDSPLPARLEADGRLRLQVRPGHWIITLITRNLQPVTALTLSQPNAPWPEAETWVFAANSALRLVEIAGGTRLDPQQVELSADWRQYPTYRVLPGETLHLIEQKRGDPDPGPDELKLNRQLWLDFNGQGYTLQDDISGTVRRSWRLEMQPVLQPGQITVNGIPQLITQQPPSPATGVEIRQGRLHLIADSRLNGQIEQLPAVGWLQDFHQLDTTLHLPPGWQLLHVSGVDNASDTWIQRWSLLDIFLVLIITLAFTKLWRWYWGLWALLTLILIYQTPSAPQWAWVNILITIALLRLIPATGRLHTLLTHYRNISFLVLSLISLAFMVAQARQGLYPQLEKPWQSATQSDYTEHTPMAALPNSPAFITAEEEAIQNQPEPMQQQTFQSNIAPAKKPGYNSYVKQKYARNVPDDQTQTQAFWQYDAKANIQTGPGLQNWRWNTVHLDWSGPVAQNQMLQLYFLNPRQQLWLNLLSIPLLTILLACIGLEIRPGKQRTRLPAQSIASMLFLSITLAGLASFALSYSTPLQAGGQVLTKKSPAADHADMISNIPSMELLDQLQARLLPPPPCQPHCTSSPSLRLEADAHSLRMIWQVHSLAHTVVPLPAQADQWLPQWVFLDGEEATALQRNTQGQLFIALTPGIHQIDLSGVLPDRSTLQIAFPLRPHHLETQVQDWRVEGIDAQHQADHIQLTRLEKHLASALEAGTLPAFVQVERTLSLGLTWQVETQVTRLSPTGNTMVLDIPLLPGEAVITDGITVKQGLAQISLSSQQSSMRWISRLTPTDTLTLTAPKTQQWAEVWKLRAGPVWHVDFTGIPIIHHQNPEGEWLPEWHPWPGEQLTLQISRPVGVDGQTLTLDHSRLDLTPGQRTTEATLTIQLRSSQGGQQRITLPPEASLRTVKINGQSQPLQLANQALVVPLVPGVQTLELIFWQNQGLRPHFISPTIALGAPSVNNTINLNLPERWILWVKGPLWGPAVLFWGALIVIGLASIILARMPFLPLATYEWFLLGIGLTQANPGAAILVLVWFIVLGQRPTRPPINRRWLFNLTQLALVGLTLAALSALTTAIQQGLLGQPDMHIAGNQSTTYSLHWFTDRLENTLPIIEVISLPLIVYRGIMLLWALWLALACLRWLRWGWQCFSVHGIWRNAPVLTQTPVTTN